MKRTGLTLLLGVLFVPLNATAETTTVCTLISDAKTGKTIIQEGKCETRATAASTFKIAISLMGFDSGILTDAHHPVWSFKEGYPDWRAAWRKDTDPQYWIEQSVVWYSQQINIRLGEAKFRDYVTSFDYGNADVSGDVAKQNGLMRSWLSSSLQISPAEQIEFVSKMIRGELPVSKQAREMAMGLFDMGVQANGWHVFGKTGAGLSQNADGRPIKGRPWGWFVGWATRGDQTVAFARLTHDSTRPAKSPGFDARDAFMAEYFATDSAF
ncbi:class D beta-lactamase [Thalassospira xiamenensis]|uniref:class D beta-lactamase n=1 Tax=Thalassospira xiamenensis TaxID=220697 RepID=UPI003AA88945